MGSQHCNGEARSPEITWAEITGAESSADPAGAHIILTLQAFGLG